MNKYDLSILIPARNEEFLAQTVKNILENKRGKTEVIVGLDGQWAEPGIDDHPDVTIVYYSESIGQRAMTNRLCAISRAKYVMKLDAHCALDEGFDVKLMEKMQDNYTMIPALYNLHAFDWKCLKCGSRWYQGAQPVHCQKEGTDGNRPEHVNTLCDGKEFEKVIVWKPRLNRRSEYYRFDTTLHFQYHRARKNHPASQGEVVETMSAQGSCFMLTREKYWELNICDENFGSWGQQGTEVALKTWLSGGKLVTNKNTWYSHMFRTQTGFGFPYPISGKQVDNARKLSRELFMENTWDKQIYPLSWLLEKFAPLDNKSKDAPDWHEPQSKEILDYVNKKGEEFYSRKNNKKGLVYYTDNQLNLKISHAVQKQLKKTGLPIVSASLKPMNLGRNIVLPYKRGWEAYFRQILAALEASEADILFFTEHDWLYHPSHFSFLPTRRDTFYYNWNWWRVRASDGHAVRYDTQLLPGICAYRTLLIDYYRKQVELLKKHGFDSDYARKTGFEPGTHNRVPELSGYRVEKWQSDFPNLDIRHDNNLTSSKWSQDAFRSPKNCTNWQVSNLSSIPGWDAKSNDFFEFLKQI